MTDFKKAFSMISGATDKDINRWEFLMKKFKPVTLALLNYKKELHEYWGELSDDEKISLTIFPIYMYLLGYNNKDKMNILIKTLKAIAEDKEKFEKTAEMMRKFTTEDDIKKYLNDFYGDDIDGFRKED